MVVKTAFKSVMGASHKRKLNPVCQDRSRIYTKIEGVTILAVADGHGSSSCLYSDEGAEKAVNSFVNVITDVLKSYDGNKESLFPLLDPVERTLAKRICQNWKQNVYDTHVYRKHRETNADIVQEKQNKSNSSIKKALIKANQDKVDYGLYGTTLLGAAITEEFMLIFQLGDGDIMQVDETGVHEVIETEKFLGIETNSMSHMMAWNYAHTSLIPLPQNRPFMLMMSSDGLSNSFSSQSGYKKCCQDYFDLVRENGIDVVRKNIEQWLDETSEGGCGDDISLALAYFE